MLEAENIIPLLFAVQHKSVDCVPFVHFSTLILSFSPLFICSLFQSLSATCAVKKLYPQKVWKLLKVVSTLYCSKIQKWNYEQNKVKFIASFFVVIFVMLETSLNCCFLNVLIWIEMIFLTQLYSDSVQ